MTAETPSGKDQTQPQDQTPATEPSKTPVPAEHGGPKGAEPTRFNDWERGGRCVDF